MAAHVPGDRGTERHRDEAKIATSRYYDVVNFARRVTAPGLYSWGYNDETCPPTSMYAAYNVITASKRLMLAYDTGHRTTQEQVDEVSDWLFAELTRATATSSARYDRESRWAGGNPPLRPMGILDADQADTNDI